ncbi:DUF1194 domain-containing protein [Phreatobacter sp.]|uniref:DUF1194 domain-containing protein n=1 Tax=Phreatobacter sp. TaxID=1966341 RepID=UPI0025CDDA8C|nr:DUF1194 domain-containing protein [Phreatobacter sp.]
MIRALILVVFLSLAGPIAAQAQSRSAASEVDVQIVLAVDISYSMDPEEQRLQREGYVKAITSPEVLDAIRKGLVGKIAVSYLEWAGHHERQVVIDWRIIDGPESAQAFAAELQSKPYRRAFRTSISGAIQASVDLLEKSGLRSLRRVIDVSGDGSNNNGPHVEIARDDALAKGIVINGLPIVIPRQNTRYVDIPNLDAYYQDCVVGGPGSFVIPITNPEEFVTATRRKLILEVAGITPVWPLPGGPFVVPAQAQKVDCLVGERIWRERWERN